MSLSEQLTTDLKTAMKAKDSATLTVVRSLKTALTNATIDKAGAGGQLDPATEIAGTIAEYEATIQQTDNPEGWSAGNIQITDLQWWSIDIDPATGVGSEAWGTKCDSGDTNLQRVSMRVTSEGGEIVEEVEVIIGE